MKCTIVATEASRRVAVGTYVLDPGDGSGPHTRVFLAAGWQSVPVLPVGPETVDIPLSALPALLEALGRLRASEAP